MTNTVRMISDATKSGNENISSSESMSSSLTLTAESANREVDIQDHVIEQLTSTNNILMRRLAISQLAEDESSIAAANLSIAEKELTELKSKMKPLAAKLKKSEDIISDYQSLVKDAEAKVKEAVAKNNANQSGAAKSSPEERVDINVLTEIGYRDKIKTLEAQINSMFDESKDRRRMTYLQCREELAQLRATSKTDKRLLEKQAAMLDDINDGKGKINLKTRDCYSMSSLRFEIDATKTSRPIRTPFGYRLVSNVKKIHTFEPILSELAVVFKVLNLSETVSAPGIHDILTKEIGALNAENARITSIVKGRTSDRKLSERMTEEFNARQAEAFEQALFREYEQVKYYAEYQQTLSK